MLGFPVSHLLGHHGGVVDLGQRRFAGFGFLDQLVGAVLLRRPGAEIVVVGEGQVGVDGLGQVLGAFGFGIGLGTDGAHLSALLVINPGGQHRA